MSKISEKKKIEEIAKNFLKNQKSYKNINTMREINKKKLDNIYNNKKENKSKKNGKETIKDNIYHSNMRNQKNIINKELNPVKNESKYNIYNKSVTQNKSNDNLKFDSSENNSLTDYYYCCKNNKENKKNLIEEDINKNNINNIINNNLENTINNKLFENNKLDKKNQNKIKEEYKNIEDNNISSDNSIINENNLDTFNKIIIIYKELMSDFSSNIKRPNKDHFKSQVLSCDFFKFLFSDVINLFIKFFNYSIDVNKFIFYQIYIFLTIIYIDENKDLNECSEMAYRTILLYSSQNYELLLNVIKKIINPNEPKIYKSLISKNKIIISVLNTLYPKKISNYDKNNKQFFFNNDNLLSFHFLEEIESETKVIKSNEIKKNLYNKLIKLISNLQKNERLINKINQIEKQNEIENIIKNNEMKKNIDKNENISSDEKNSILPEFDTDRYKYSIFIDLDETIVHYYEKDNNYFVKVRVGSDDFIKSMSKFCEIIIISSSAKEYTDIIINNYNKDRCYVNYTIYKELFDEDNEVLDLSLINRDMKKCIFICHTDDFFNAPKSNIIKLSEFVGEENDQEFVYLNNELKKLSINNISDVKDFLQNIKINESDNNI